jgi:predicted amidohydrolase YtcJ
MRMFEFRRIIDTGGATMLPGMIELYAHLRWFPTDGLICEQRDSAVYPT